MNDQSILAPISEKTPAGEDLRRVEGDSTFHRVREMMRESALGPDGEERLADWKGVVRECESALQERTKDIELAAWWTVGRMREAGFEGLEKGLALIRELLGLYWEQVHPGFEDHEIVEEIRARPLNWIGSSEQFLLAVKELPLTAAEGMRPLNWFDYEETERVDGAQRQADPTLFNELREQDRKTTDEWLLALSGTPSDWSRKRDEALARCRSELQQLNKLCGELFAEDEVPAYIKLEDLIETICLYFTKGETHAGEGEDAEPEETGANDARGGAEDAETPSGPGPVGPFTSRAEAMRCLREVGRFLRGTEPHSPVSYLVERAARWGEMPFEEVICEIVKSPDARGHIWDTLGIFRPEEGHESE